jgi:4-amino-4-deoxy-L-arabinose transferase-like glycosyltransferase
MIPAFRRRPTAIVLTLIILIGAVLRVAWLTSAPPGLNQDEAANAWNAYCLLKTGKDQAGVSWPILYTRAMGENRSTLFIYLMLPFQAIGGLNVWTTRLPAAFFGVLTIALIYWTATRMFGRTAGMVAAALIAIDPWHIQLSRWGHEASIAPLLALLPLATAIWAGLLPGDAAPAAPARPRIGRALAAGAVAGLCCYGYPAVRLFAPVFLCFAGILVVLAARRSMSVRETARGVAAYAAGMAAVLGPLAYEHFAHAESIGRRGATLWVWSPDDSPGVRAGKVLARYAAHFDPRFLFLHGDLYEVNFAAGPEWLPSGQLPWYVLPLLLAGIIALAGQARRSPAARIALLFLVLYPLGDCLHLHGDPTHPRTGLHALRSAIGLCGIVLVSAAGAAWAFERLCRASRPTAAVVAGALGVAAIALTGVFLVYYFGGHTRRPAVRHGFHVDLVESCRRLRPQEAGFDAIFCTTKSVNQPSYITLVMMGHDPTRWFAEPRDLRRAEGVGTSDDWDYCYRYGKWWFLYDRSVEQELIGLARNGRRDRVALILRPEEVGPDSPLRSVRPADVIEDDDGNVALVVYDVLM